MIPKQISTKNGKGLNNSKGSQLTGPKYMTHIPMPK